MWIPHYIDMNPHFSQNILNKGIFRTWIHRYIDMYPHCLDNSKKKVDVSTFSSLLRNVSRLPGHQRFCIVWAEAFTEKGEIFGTTYFASKRPLTIFTFHPYFYNVTVSRRDKMAAEFRDANTQSL